LSLKMNKEFSASYFDEFILKELNEHLKALISLSMQNKSDIEYIKYKLDTLEKKLENVDLINVLETPKTNKWNWPRNPGFDILSQRDD
jgi:hypothetical protein